MGLNLLLLDPAGREHPQWDPGKFVGDRDFARMVMGLPLVRDSKQPERLRPGDWAAWRAAAADANRSANAGRLAALIDLLEADPRYALVIDH